ncbi:MAG: DUF523 and DUF1722 domain-containing protein [candidate division WOR-3 bacterium]|nr:DUF523 and DUF1722 domain-containing protein [candidate division WOR-3 bacterium]
MRHFIKPNVVISKCLGFAKCRYNGDIIIDYVVEKLKPFVNFIPVCPEVEIGLGVPREPLRLIWDKATLHLYQPATKKDFTHEMELFIERYLSSLSEIDGFILKYRSPSCGISGVKIYNGFHPDARATQGRGFFGRAVLERFNTKAIEDEGRLKNFTIRENFFTKLFTLASFRVTKKHQKIKELIRFHTINKLLFMAYSQVKLNELGRIVANYQKGHVDIVFSNYEKVLYQLLARMPTFKSWINVLLHAFGGISAQLNKKERAFFLNLIEEYRDERIPLSVLIKIIEGWAVRFGDSYLLEQTFLNPYPKELIEITDSGKGRNR